MKHLAQKLLRVVWCLVSVSSETTIATRTQKFSLFQKIIKSFLLRIRTPRLKKKREGEREGEREKEREAAIKQPRSRSHTAGWGIVSRRDFSLPTASYISM